MRMTTNARPFVKELLENENLIVSYVELNDGGFDLSVRIDEDNLNRGEAYYNLIKTLEQKRDTENE